MLSILNRNGEGTVYQRWYFGRAVEVDIRVEAACTVHSALDSTQQDRESSAMISNAEV